MYPSFAPRAMALRMVVLLGVAANFWFCAVAVASNIPARPDTYFFDPSHFIPQAAAKQINLQLAQFERATSDQVLVAIFPDLPEGEALEDFTQRTAEAWQVGQKERNNGVVLFVFVKPRKIRIEVGYGLEGALPDITARRIISQEIAPAFKAGDPTSGIVRGIQAIFSAIRGEYRGTGSLASEQRPQDEKISAPERAALIFFGIVLLIFLTMLLRKRGSGYLYGPSGGSALPGPFWGFPLDGRGQQDRERDDDGFGGSGGGFRGGGGSFGGGGASGGW